MRLSIKFILIRLPALVLSLFCAFESVAIAQDEGSIPLPPEAVSTQTQPAFSQPELDQMLAPIALYPDSLLSQILMASTYPLEVVEAARWSRSNPTLRGDDAVRAVQQNNWDPSVISLVAFPQILQRMDENLAWTERLGDAFLAQQTQVMDTVQSLRQTAYAAGNLSSNEQIRVAPEAQIIAIEPANPMIVYVPYYDPAVVYGSWWWPAYPPIFWAPWPGYYFESGFAWDIGIIISAGFFFGDCDWHHHHVNVVNVNNYYYNRKIHEEMHPGHNVNHDPGVWHHDPDHRRGVPYRESSLRQQYGRTSASPETRRGFRGYDQPVFSNSGESGNRPIERGNPTVSPNHHDDRQGNHGGIPDARPTENRPEVGGGSTGRIYEQAPHVYPSVQREVSRPSVEIRPHALEDISHGTSVRDYSSRGRASSEGNAHSQSNTPEQRSSGNASGGGKMKYQR
jgi:Protein of unknown function (DUF3300)